MVTKKDVGVIVGRFQTTELHQGHLYLMMETARRHKQVLILLGSARVQNSRRNPLDYETRKLMISHLFPQFKVQPLWDMPSDRDWSVQIDKLIGKVFPRRWATLYGSRDSCLRHYSGQMKTKNIAPISDASATALRNAIRPKSSRNFREGVIHSANVALPTSFQAVDIVIVNKQVSAPKILLGRKTTDPKGQWRFPGGFVDPKDGSLEAAAYREALEEVGPLEMGGSISLEYLGSLRVQDWRYKQEDSKIMTAVFRADYMWGHEKAGDDLQKVQWFRLKKLRAGHLVPNHRAILALVKRKVKS